MKIEKIKQLIKALASDEENIEKAIEGLVDLDSFYTFWAIEGLLGSPDGYSGLANNYFIHLNPETDKFHFIPWGADNIFTRTTKESDPRGPLSVKTRGLIVYRLYQTPAGRERYRQTLHGILNQYWDEVKLLTEIDRIEAMLKPHLVEAQLKFGYGLEEARTFIRQRRDELMNETVNGMPEWKKAPSGPIMLVSVGRIRAKFAAKFFEDSPQNGAGLGQVEFELTMAGKKVELKNLGVHASWSWASGKGKTGERGKSRTPAIRFVGERVDTGEKLSFELIIDEDKFTVDEAPIQSEGKIVTDDGRAVRGPTKLTAASLDEGGRVEGEFEGEIMEMKGFDRAKRSKPKSKRKMK